MKKCISLLLALCVLLALAPASALAAESGEPLRIVTTIFPVYDWVMNILGERAADAEVSMLLDSGVDLHSYQPTVEDIVKISTCDLFIYVGGESDDWVADALAEAVNRDMRALNLLELLGDGAKEEEIVEGMEAEEEDDADEEESEYDEHVWLSLQNAALLCGGIADALCQMDGANAPVYRANAEAYQAQLTALDAAYRAAVDAAPVKTLLFGDRFPFRYLVDDYGLGYYAAFVGCSAETEASFKTIIFLSGKLDELGLPAICQIESADGAIARTVRDNTKTKDQQILTFDSMQSTTARDAAAGASYLGVMRGNLEVLRAALN